MQVEGTTCAAGARAAVDSWQTWTRACHEFTICSPHSLNKVLNYCKESVVTQPRFILKPNECMFMRSGLVVNEVDVYHKGLQSIGSMTAFTLWVPIRTPCTSSVIFKTLPEDFASRASVTEVVLDARIKRSNQRSWWIRIAQLKVEMVMEKKATPQMETRWKSAEVTLKWMMRGNSLVLDGHLFPSKNIFL